MSGVLLAVEIGLFLFMMAGTHGLIVPLKRPTSTDFVSFYAAGSLADAGTPQLAYDRGAHYTAEQQATQPGIVYNFFYYPPVSLLLCAALARLPYLAAFVVFEALTLVFYVAVIRRILRERGWAVVIPILAFPPVLWTLGFGQNGLLTAATLGTATLLVDRRPLAAGLAFGVLCGKPHFAVLVPVALAAGRRWRVLCASLVFAGALGLLSAALFGLRTWQDFFRVAAGAGDVYASGRIAFGGFVTPFGAAMLLGAAPATAAIVQACVTAAATGFVAFVWGRDLPLPVRAASLVSATLVAVPVALFYDLTLAGVAGAWLLRADGKYRLPEWGKATLAALYVLCVNPRGIAGAWHVPIGSVVALALAALSAVVALRGAVPPRGDAGPAAARFRSRLVSFPRRAAPVLLQPGRAQTG
jgi:alpha-1,2-mannosyltransferase